ncbi:phosphopantetheine-binding protein [Streptomyces sp. JJ38]|uniref:phosphopantetheine-binding protein n=1 Tax=Streptomyces sp. JJ38 TaxID=2738128 RepID=UPI00214B87F0|nr:phosphopantetheine-binding protein [Streptomyces sp. JJ38]
MTAIFTAEHVADVFRELLDHDDVREDDDWFEIGGTSLTGLTLVARLNKAAGVTLRLRDVVRAPTPEALAGVIEERSAELPGAPK